MPVLAVVLVLASCFLHAWWNLLLKSAADKQAFTALFLLVPVFLAEVVNEYGPQIRDLQATIGAMHPHSPLFRQWLAAESQAVGLMLQFDNHGKKVDYCEAAKVLLAKGSTDADIYRVTGLHAVMLAKLFGSKASSTVTRLNPSMRAFFVAAGLSAAQAQALTSS